MQTSRSDTSIKIKELLLLEIQTISLSKFSSRNQFNPCYMSYLLAHQDSVLGQLQATNVISFKGNTNKNLSVFSYLLLKCIYGESLNRRLLNMVKVNLYDSELDLKSIQQNGFEELQNEEMKKIVAEFMVELYFTNYHVVFQKTLKKYPVILQIMEIFLRCLLVKLGLQEAKYCSNKLPTQTVIELLSDYFHLPFVRHSETYLYFQNKLLIYEKTSSEILFGSFNVTHKKLLIDYEANPENLSIKLSDQSKQFKAQQQSPDSSLIQQKQSVSFIPVKKGYVQAKSPRVTDKKAAEQKLTLEASNLQKNSPCYAVCTPTPSMASLQQKLGALVSPIYSQFSQHSLSKFKMQSRFQLATAINQQFFCEQSQPVNANNSTIKEQVLSQGCGCKEKAKLHLKLNSNAYSLKLNQSSQPFKFQVHRSANRQNNAKKEYYHLPLRKEAGKGNYRDLLSLNVQKTKRKTLKIDEQSSCFSSVSTLDKCQPLVLKNQSFKMLMPSLKPSNYSQATQQNDKHKISLTNASRT